jgi:hypothetical protein
MNPKFRHLIAGLITGVALLSSTFLLPTKAADKTKAEDKSILSQLIGEWEEVSRGDGKPLPADFGEFKFIGGKHWSVLNVDSKTKSLRSCLGGTYTLNGNEYVESVEYGTPNMPAEMIGQKFKFKVTVEGDKFTQIGIGNGHSYIFRRAK